LFGNFTKFSRIPRPRFDFAGGGAFTRAAAPFAISGGGAQRDLDYDKRRPFFNFSPRENAPAFLPREYINKISPRSARENSF